MFADCHVHMILDGVYYRAAIDHQKAQPDDALIRSRLADYAARGGEAVTIEPHLRVFDGLRELERGQKTALQEGVYPTEDAAFDAACGALRKLI